MGQYIEHYNPFLVYFRELAPGTVSLTGDWAQGDDSKHDSHFFFYKVFTCYNSLILLSADNLLQTVRTQMKTNRMSVLIWIQSV